MINFSEFSQSHLKENSLYTNQTEKDDLVKNKQKLLDAFYLNFFTLIGMFSIEDNPAMQKYIASEGRLIVANINDKNNDISLAIRLLYDQNMIQRGVVDKMTKLLAKLKMKQIKPSEVDANVIRSLLTDMQYTSHRGSPQVMAVLDDFVNSKIELKHVAYQFYTLAKKKDFKSITAELRNVGKNYNSVFKKIGANQVAAAPQPAIVAPVTNNLVQGVAKVTRKKVSDTIVPPAVQDVAPPLKAAPVAKGKIPEFWHALYNARGKVEFNKIFKQYGVDGETITYIEYVDNAKMALSVGKINLDSVKKSFGYATFKSESFSEYDLFFKSIILDAKSLLDIAEPFATITDKYSKTELERKFIKTINTTDETNQHVIALSKVLIDSITQPIDPIKPESKDFIDRVFLTSVRKGTNKVNDLFSIEQRIKICWLFGSAAVDANDIKKYLSSTLGIVFKVFGPTDISSDQWESQVSKEARDLLNDFGIMNILDINIVQSAGFDKDLSSVKDYASFTTFVQKVVRPIVEKSINYKLDDAKGNKLLDQTMKIFGSVGYTEIGEYFKTLKAVIKRSDWVNTFWDTYYNNSLKSFANGDISTIAFARRVIIIQKNGGVIANLNSDMRTFESKFLDVCVKTAIQKQRIDTDIAPLIIASASDNFLNNFIKKTISIFDDYDYFTFSGVPFYQVISKEVAQLLFEMVEKSNWDINIYKLAFVQRRIKNSDEFGEWLADYLVGKNIDARNKKIVISWMISAFPNYEPSMTDLELVYTLNDIVGDSLNTYKNNKRMMEFLSYKVLKDLEDDKTIVNIKNAIPLIIKNDENILKNIFTDKMTETQVSGALTAVLGMIDMRGFGQRSKEKYGFGLKCATTTLQAIGPKFLSNAKSAEIVDAITESLATPNSIQKEYRESVFTDVSSIFANGDITAESELAFAKFDKKAQKVIAGNMAQIEFVKSAVDEINNNATIKPRSKLPEMGALKVLKINQVNIPASEVIDFRKMRGAEVSLSAVKDIAGAAAKSYKLEEQAISEVPTSDEQLEKLSVVYNRFNRYKHGGIAVRIHKVFNVNISSQQIGWKEYLDEIAPAIKAGTYYHKFPQFHGTASLPASMILRYGFSVIDKKLAQEAGIKYAGRMFGDGIYSSNVIDKVSQYINDDAPTGVSRRRGVIGYVFEMDTHGSSWGRKCDVLSADFSTGGTGEFPGEDMSLVSPEWVWRYANKQCKIKRCFEVELINKDEMDELVSKHKDVMEEIGRYSFKDYLLYEADEKIEAFKLKNYASFTFMDNIVPVGNGNFVDLNEEPESNLKLPAGTTIDHGMYGVTIMFNSKENFSARLLYGSDINTNYEVRSLYEKFLKRKV